MLRLKRLDAKACRGIFNGPEIEFSDGGLLLCGDNGTGKSSFVDAIEKVLAERCGSLDTGDQTISWARYGKHAKSDQPASADLTLTNGSQDFRLRLGESQLNLPKELRELLAAAAGQSFILRRRNILRYIDAKPAERGRAIEGLLQIRDYTELERKLKALRDAAREVLTRKEQYKRQSEAKLRANLGLAAQAAVDANSSLSALNKALEGTGLMPLVSLDEAEQRIVSSGDRLARFGDMSALPFAVALRDAVSAMPSISTVLVEGRAYAEARQALLNEEQKLRGHFYKEVLEKGLAWIKEDSLGKCPLCESAIDIGEVEAYVHKRIAENQSIISLTANQVRAKGAFSTALDAYSRALRDESLKWKPAMDAEFPEQGKLVLQAVDLIKDRHGQLADPSVILDDVRVVEQGQFDEITGELRGLAEKKVQSFANRVEYEALLKAKAVLQSFVDGWQELAQCTGSLRRANESLGQLSVLVGLAEEARKVVVRRLIAAIAKQADSYFQKIHANENIGQAELTVPDRGVGSVELTAVFYGERGDPRGMYSEGHLDSLGLCIFLAVRRLHYKQHPELALLVLDDVMHSVDGAHRLKTAELVFEEFRDHQLVITTHDPIWFEFLKGAARKQDPGRRYTQLRIAGWSIADGPSWGDHLSDYEWLVSVTGKAAKPADRAIKAGRLLEEMLRNLCDALTVAVEYRIKSDHTIDPLWGPFRKRAAKHTEFWSVAKRSVEAIDSLRSVRNWVGAHCNEWAGLLTDEEARRFADAVIELRDLVFCPDCGEFIARIGQLEGVWSCTREHKRYKKTSAPVA